MSPTCREWCTGAETCFHSLEAYLQHRITNVAFKPYSLLILYAMEITLTYPEMQVTEQFRNVIAKSYSLTNDYWSWKKEPRVFEKGEIRMHNAVPVIMEERGISATEACRVMRQLIIDYEQEALGLRDGLLAEPGQSDDMKQYLDGHI